MANDPKQATNPDTSKSRVAEALAFLKSDACRRYNDWRDKHAPGSDLPPTNIDELGQKGLQILDDMGPEFFANLR